MPSSRFRNRQERLLDPVYRHARREAIEILLVWAVALAWTVGYCGYAGYASEGEELKTLLGIPAWVFWGVAAPWGVCALYSIFYSLLRIKDDPLGEDLPPTADSRPIDRPEA